MRIRPFLLVFLAAFALNLLWENLHVPLYAHYQGGAITEYILFRAALFDAVVITLFAVFALVALPVRWRQWFVFVAGTLFAVLFEIWALRMGRWEYIALMPLVPFLNVGLSPALQLGATGWLVLLMLERWKLKI